MFTSLFVGRLKIKSGELKICQKNIYQINQEILKASKTYHWKVEKLSKKYTYNYLRVFQKDFMRMGSKLDYLRLCVSSDQEKNSAAKASRIIWETFLYEQNCNLIHTKPVPDSHFFPYYPLVKTKIRIKYSVKNIRRQVRSISTLSKAKYNCKK